MTLNQLATLAALSAGAALIAGGAFAAGTATGGEAGGHSIHSDLSTILSGAGGYMVMIISVIIGGVALAITGRWTLVMSAAGLALVLGYGVQTISSLGGVTADVSMLSDVTAITETQPSAGEAAAVTGAL